MSETRPTCQIHKKYSWIECTNPALDGDPDSYCILHSQKREKDPEAFGEAVQARFDQEGVELYDFRGVFFPGPFSPEGFLRSQEINKAIDFSKAVFAGEASFFNDTFIEEAIFRGTTFEERALFLDSTLKKEALFYGATFMKEAEFSGATFRDKTYFSGAAFKEKANFYWVTFMGAADFSEATFTKEGDFSRATFKEGAYFSAARVRGWVVFEACNPPRPGPPPAFQGEFRYLELAPGSVLRFKDMALAQSEFKGTDLRRVEFYHVQWHPYRAVRQSLMRYY